MHELLMFNPNTLAQQFLRIDDKSNIDKLREKGWIINPPLIAMYNPVLKKHVNVLVGDKKVWENKGYFSEPRYVYHPKETTRLVSEEEAKKLFQNGWYASPAHFPGNDIGKIKTPNISKEAA